MLVKDLVGEKSINSVLLGKGSQNDSRLRNLQLLIHVDKSCEHHNIQILSKENGA